MALYKNLGLETGQGWTKTAQTGLYKDLIRLLQGSYKAFLRPWLSTPGPRSSYTEPYSIDNSANHSKPDFSHANLI